MSEQTLLLIGASRGLGLALAREFIARGWRVVATERSPSAELHGLAGQSAGRLEIETLDIVDESAIAALRQRLAERRFDLLFVNAGVGNGMRDRIGDSSAAEFARVMTTNAFGPLRVVDACFDLVAANGAIGVMSSGLGSVANNTSGGWEVYRASKAALNMLARSYAARPEAQGRSFVVVAPGWVRTDMGGPNAPLSVDESIPRVADVLIGQLGKPGVRYLNYRGETLPW